MYTYIFQNDITGCTAYDTHLFLRLTTGYTLLLHVYDECGNTLGSHAHVGLCVYNRPVSQRRHGDKGLTAIQDIVVTVFYCGGLHAACVGTCARLSQREADLLFAGYNRT